VELVLSCLRQEEAARDQAAVHLALDMAHLVAPTNMTIGSSTVAPDIHRAFTRLERFSSFEA
jgi:hypothetical protein